MKAQLLCPQFIDLVDVVLLMNDEKKSHELNCVVWFFFPCHFCSAAAQSQLAAARTLLTSNGTVQHHHAPRTSILATLNRATNVPSLSLVLWLRVVTSQSRQLPAKPAMVRMKEVE
jgi:hypothetical protein